MILNRIVKEENGQVMTEYGLILGLIATIVIFKDEITTLFNSETDDIETKETLQQLTS